MIKKDENGRIVGCFQLTYCNECMLYIMGNGCPNHKKPVIIKLNEDAHDDECFISRGIEFAIYWYECGGYGGWGQCLMMKDDKWYHCDLSHCSCYGPFEDIDEALKKPIDSLDEAFKQLKDYDYSGHYKEMINAIREAFK